MAGTLKYGSQGGEVKTLQQMLNKNGANLTVDGIFGKNTQNAVMNYQKNNGLAVDGIAGKNTWGTLLSSDVSGNSSGDTSTGATSGYTPTAAPTITPTPDAPTYDTSTWDESEKGSAAGSAYEAAKDAVANYGDFSFSEQGWLDSIKDDIKNYGEFSYDVNSDALYQQYAEQYMRQGKLAMQDAMGQAAALTGGFGNSYAATVGNQAYQSYLQQLNDRVPELYKLALDRYNMGKQDLYDQYGMLLSEYEREYGLYSDEYNQLLDALGIAKDDYYSGADMFYTEQGNKNNVLGQGFNDSMAIWNANNDNAWRNAEWTENNNRYANEESWREKEWERDEDRYQDSLETYTSGGSGGGSGSGAGGNGSGGGTGGGNTSGVTDAIRNKAASFTSNTDLASYLDGLEASGEITAQEADSLYAQYADENEKYVTNDDGSTTISYKDMIGSSKGWTVVDKGGGNLWGIDANAVIKAPNGETIRLDQLRDKLKSEGMTHSEATNAIKKLQQNLGISSNWMFGW